MNQIIIWKDMIVFWGKNPKAVSEHQHPSVQLVLALKDSFTSKNEYGEWIDKTGLIIAPNHFHECNAKNTQILSIDIDPESTLGDWVLKNQLNSKMAVDFPRESIDGDNFEKMSNSLEHGDWSALREIVENLLQFQGPLEWLQKDDRIEKVLYYISKNIENPITTQNLTEIAYLSESRLLHMFKKSMGLPIRNYILWLRLKIALSQIVKNRSLTEAAYAAGFSDQAHFTRTCVNMIGLPPSILSKNSKFIQVSFPS